MVLLPTRGHGPLTLAPNVEVERLGFGTWAWGNKLLWGYDEAADPVLEAAFRRAVAGAPLVDRRRFFFDTGDSYGTGAREGRAESLLGRFRREARARRRVAIGTKLAVYPWRLRGEDFEDACRASLRRMGESRMELVQAHWSAANFQPWQEPALWDGLARCYEAGLAGAVGTSNFGPKQLRKANAHWASRGVPHSANQAQLHVTQGQSRLISAHLGLISDHLGSSRLIWADLGSGAAQPALDAAARVRPPRG